MKFAQVKRRKDFEITNLSEFLTWTLTLLNDNFFSSLCPFTKSHSGNWSHLPRWLKKILMALRQTFEWKILRFLTYFEKWPAFVPHKVKRIFIITEAQTWGQECKQDLFFYLSFFSRLFQIEACLPFSYKVRSLFFVWEKRNFFYSSWSSV